MLKFIVAWAESAFRFLPFFFFSVGEPPGREPPCCTSQSEEENLLVRLAPHPSLANASEDLVYLCRDKPRHLGCDGTEQQRWVSAHTAGSEVSKPDIVSARTWQISWAVPQENTSAKCINPSGLSLFYVPALTSVHDYWKNNSFD